MSKLALEACYEACYDVQVNYLLRLQLHHGGIPEHKDSFINPWNHIECCLALLLSGKTFAAKKGLSFLISQQHASGGWSTKIGDSNHSTPQFFECHHASYIFVLIYLDLSINQTTQLENSYENMFLAALDFVLTLQNSCGLFYWGKDTTSKIAKLYLKTANCNVYLGLCAALNCLERPAFQHLSMHIQTLKNAINNFKLAYINHQNLFDASKARYSMDSFYPILSGLSEQTESKKLLAKLFDNFIVEPLGCLCVSDEPWITFAETAELMIALSMLNKTPLAKQVLDWVLAHQDSSDGLFWMGYQYKQKVYWPKEKPSWTAAALILAMHHIFKCQPQDFCFEYCLKHQSLCLS